MAFPKKFKHLIEIENKDVETPDYVWLVYAVCAVEQDSCGWGGWIIDAPFQGDREELSDSHRRQNSCPADYMFQCPTCRKHLFRTSAQLRLEPSKDQTPAWVEGVLSVSSPIEYED